MTFVLEVLFLALLIAMSATYSGSETGFYCVSPLQVELDVKRGSRRAALMRWLLRDEAALLVTILIGNNLALEIATHVGEEVFGSALGLTDPGVRAVAVTLILTPLVFLFGEALPKDVFRLRPHALTGLAAPVIGLSRVVFWPLERALRILTLALERMLGLSEDATAPISGRDAVRRYLEEGRRHGALSARTEGLARNALRLRSTHVEDAMVPWSKVECLVEGMPRAEALARVRASRFSRIPVLASGADGAALQPPRVLGYVHQLEVLHADRAAAEGGSESSPGLPDTRPDDALQRSRPLWTIDAETTVGRALGEFSAKGRRIALVERSVRGPDGGAEGGAREVVGLVTVNDLLDLISTEVVR